MKKILLTVVAAIILMPALKAENGDDTNLNKNKATSVLSGKVIDKTTGESLAGVKVEVDGTNFVAYTDFDGNFAFQGIFPGTYTVSTSLISYEKKIIKSIEVHQNEIHSLNVNLTTVEQN